MMRTPGIVAVVVVLLLYSAAALVDENGIPDYSGLQKELGTRQKFGFRYYDYYPPTGQAVEDFPTLQVTFEDARVLEPTASFEMMGVEKFNGWPKDKQGVGQNATNFGLDLESIGVDPRYPAAWYGLYEMFPNDMFGGADAVGDYPRVGPSRRFGVAFNKDLKLTYFGQWISSLDAGNVLYIRTAEDGYFRFGAEHVLASLTLRPDEDLYFGNPVPGPYMGSNPSEVYAYVNLFFNQTSIVSILFDQWQWGGAYESDNHCVGIWNESAGNELYATEFPVHPEIEVEKPEIEQPEVEKPEIEQPEVEKPEIEQPEVEKPEVEQPEVEKPEVEQPEVEKPEVEQPEVEKPEVEQPEVEKPEVEQPEGEKPEVEQPEGEKPEVEQPEVEKPEVEQPEVEKPEVEQPEGEKPEVEQPEVEKPEVEQPEVEKPEVEQPEVEKPEVEQPEGERPEIEEPPMSTTTEPIGGGPPVGAISGAAAGGVAALAGLGYAAYSFFPSQSTPPLEAPSAQNEMEITETEREQAASSDGLWA